MQKTLIIGYGNPGRVDDGVGPICVKQLEQLNLDADYFTFDSDYQLTLETSFDISQHDEVIFVDASLDGLEPFYFEAVRNVQHESFSTHSISPESLMQLTNCIYNVSPKAWILGIRGYEFNKFGEYISDQAKKNTDAAFDFLKEYLQAKIKPLETRV